MEKFFVGSNDLGLARRQFLFETKKGIEEKDVNTMYVSEGMGCILRIEEICEGKWKGKN